MEHRAKGKGHGRGERKPETGDRKRVMNVENAKKLMANG